jgi:hypothetical protein
MGVTATRRTYKPSAPDQSLTVLAHNARDPLVIHAACTDNRSSVTHRYPQPGHSS